MKDKKCEFSCFREQYNGSQVCEKNNITNLRKDIKTTLMSHLTAGKMDYQKDEENNKC
jgi:hypothetical protein